MGREEQNMSARRKYNKRQDDGENGLEVEKELALAELRPWIESLSREELNAPCFVIGPKTFTPRQIIREIERATEDGRTIVRMMTEHRLELAKREEEINE